MIHKSRSDLLKNWEPVIGLEIHIQLNTRTKMFCGCRNQPGDEPNIHTCPICLGLPGALPVLNEQAIDSALRMGLAVQGRVRKQNRFARKNYFYPDLPKGYQISQYEEPIIEGGTVLVWWQDSLVEIQLTRIHLEEDAGKSIHTDDAKTLVDFNRCGTPLIEVVSEPVMGHPELATRTLQRLRQIVLYLGISEANPEMGEFRCDANISIRRRGTKKLGTKTEMKNMNSFRAVERALWFEIQRQAEVLDTGHTVKQSTLLWDEKNNRAELMRSKEDAPDYRYFPDPDLVPLDIPEERIRAQRDRLPELPHKKELRWVKDHDLRLSDALILSDDPFLADFFDRCQEYGVPGSIVAKWIIGEGRRLIKEQKDGSREYPLDPRRFTGLVKLVEKGMVNPLTGKAVLRRMISDNRSPEDIVREEGLEQVSNQAVLVKAIKVVLDGHGEEVTRYRSGEKKLFGFFMGEVMKSMGGKSNPSEVKALLEQYLL